MPMIVQLLEKAERWQRGLASGSIASRAELARSEKTSTGRVSQILRLLDLPRELLAAIRRLPPGTPPRLITERMLRWGLSKEEAASLVLACEAASAGH